MYRVIVPLDGSPRAEQALGLALPLARALGSGLTLVQVVNNPVIFDPLSANRAPEVRHYLDSLSLTLPSTVDAETMLREGDPARELIALAEEQAETLVVMSTHGRSGLGRLVFGSVADKVARSGAAPVALVRQPVKPREQLRRLLLPLDGSALAEETLALAIRLTRLSGAALHLVRVLSPSWMPPAGHAAQDDRFPVDSGGTGQAGLVDDARDYLDRMAQRIRHRGPETSWEVRFGRPGEEIVRLAETLDADLVLMSSHGRGGVQRWAFGSVTNEVLQGGDVPVLVIHPRAVQTEHQPALNPSPAKGNATA